MSYSRHKTTKWYCNYITFHGNMSFGTDKGNKMKEEKKEVEMETNTSKCI